MYRLLALSAAFAIGLTPSPAMADHYNRYYHHHDNDDEVAAAVIGGVVGLVTGYAIGSNRYYGYGYYGRGYGYGYPGYGYAVPAYPYPPPPPVYGYGYYGGSYPYGYYGGYRSYRGVYVAPYGTRYADRPRYYYRRY